jgi:putative ABC transport system ATP-binding protein
VTLLRNLLISSKRNELQPALNFSLREQITKCRPNVLLSLRKIEKTYITAEGPLKVLRGISFDLAAGKSLALTGESGCGKSTLLHLVAGLDQPNSGHIEIAGVNIAGLNDTARAALRRTSVGLVFQQFNLISSLNVGANLTFHAQLSGRYDSPWTETIIARLGLSELLARYPEQLSGGQQQRVAIGRTLAAKPLVVLADEPTGNLDEATGDAVLDLMLSMVKDAGSALIMATHSPRLAARLDGHLKLHAGQTSA